MKRTEILLSLHNPNRNNNAYDDYTLAVITEKDGTIDIDQITRILRDRLVKYNKRQIRLSNKKEE